MTRQLTTIAKSAAISTAAAVTKGLTAVVTTPIYAAARNEDFYFSASDYSDIRLVALWYAKIMSDYFETLDRLKRKEPLKYYLFLAIVGLVFFVIGHFVPFAIQLLIVSLPLLVLCAAFLISEDETRRYMTRAALIIMFAWEFYHTHDSMQLAFEFRKAAIARRQPEIESESDA